MRHNATNLRQRLTLQKPQYNTQQGGDITLSWIDVTNLWAKIENDGGRERQLRHGEQATQRYKITIRAGIKISPDMRFIDDNKIINIQHIYDPDGRGKWITCKCTTIWGDITQQEQPPAQQ